MSELTQTELKINIGPQHPSTHGVLRLVLELDGEEIKSCKPVVGYLHRGMEKMAENRTYLQYLPIVDRVDYLSGFFYSFAYCDSVEHLANIEVPRRANYIRVLTMEMNRLASHLLWLGTFILDLGATSPYFYTFRDREEILTLLEELTGQRMMYNYYTFGGVIKDVNVEWLEKVFNFIRKMPNKINDYENIITNNPIFTSRTKNVGILTKSAASQYSITGPNLRASGVELDFRKKSSLYENINFKIKTASAGDCFSRYKVRIEEMRECLKIIFKCVDLLGTFNDDFCNKVNPVNLKPQEGEYISSVEAPRGLASCYIKSDGTSKPYRLKWRTGSFYAVQAIEKIALGAMYPDLISIIGSLDIVLPEVDR
jgi:NADH:ubiquinone oxidoreductase subunit D